jgi:DNA-binding transcriptional LysR family regulator
VAEDGFDLALRLGEAAEPRVVARQLASVEITACASPGYLKKHGRPRLPSELADHSCIIDKTVRGGSDWTFHRGGETDTVCVNARIKVNCTHTVRKFLLAGAGIGLCPEGFVRKEIGNSHLEKLFDDFTIENQYAYVIYPRGRKLAPIADVFVDFLAKSFKLSGESEEPE